MRRLSTGLIVAFGLLAFGAESACAQYKPYEPTTATFNVIEDAALKDLVASLQKAATDQNMPALQASLAKSFTVITCKPDPALPCAPGKKGVKQMAAKLSPAERLAQGLCCAGVPRAQITKEMIAESVVGQFGAALEAGPTGAHPDVAGAACLPGWPLFDRAKAARIARAAGIEPGNLRVADNEVPIRLKPDAKEPVAETLPKGAVVPLVTDLDRPPPDGWNAIALAKGGLGYTDALGLNEMAPAGLCFVREGTIWKAGFFVLREE